MGKTDPSAVIPRPLNKRGFEYCSIITLRLQIPNVISYSPEYYVAYITTKDPKHRYVIVRSFGPLRILLSIKAQNHPNP